MNARIKISLSISVAILAIVTVIVVAQKGLAWTNPTANPPFGGQAINVSAGNVGIGNATPAYKLDVSGDVNFTGTLRQNGTPFSAGNQWATTGTSIYNTNTGNVGIGNATPAVKLHLQQANAGNFFTIESTDGISAGGYSEMRFLAGSRSGYIWVRNQNGAAGEGDGAFNIYSESGDVNLWAAATRIITVKPNSNVGIGTTDPTSQMAGTYGVAVYNASYPAIGFKNSTTNWLWYGAGSTLRLWNGSAGDILFANTSGSIGLGTGSPAYKLDVNGDIRTNANMYVSGIRMQSDSDYYLRNFSGNNIAGGFELMRNDGNRWGYFYGDNNGVGILSGNGSWAVRATGSINAENTDVSFYTNNVRRAYLSSSGLYFDGSNPYINASSYFIAPGGAYFNGGRVYTESSIAARGGIHNDTNTYLTISGGTSGYTYFSGNVGIGTTAPVSKLSVGGAGVSDATIYGEASANYTSAFKGVSTGYNAYGVIGEAMAGASYGVIGNGGGIGVYGWSPDNEGVRGTGGSYGVRGEATKATGIGVYGVVAGSLPNTYGVYGVNTGSRGMGVTGVSGVDTGVAGSGGAYDFYAYGAGVNYGASSSGRWKKNVTPMSDLLGKIANISPVYFDWDEEHGGRRDLGFIGEEVGKYFPEVVVWDKDAPGFVTGMDYSKMTPILLGAIKEQQKQIENLEERLSKLEK